MHISTSRLPVSWCFRLVDRWLKRSNGTAKTSYAGKHASSLWQQLLLDHPWGGWEGVLGECLEIYLVGEAFLWPFARPTTRTRLRPNFLWRTVRKRVAALWGFRSLPVAEEPMFPEARCQCSTNHNCPRRAVKAACYLLIEQEGFYLLKTFDAYFARIPGAGHRLVVQLLDSETNAPVFFAEANNRVQLRTQLLAYLEPQGFALVLDC